MLRPIAVIQKRDRFSLGYKPNRRGRQRFMEEKREKRIASFLEKEKESARIEIPPLSHTFRSAGFINPGAVWSKVKEMSMEVDEAHGSLSIDMVEVEDQGAQDYLYSHEDKPWIIGPLLNFSLSLK